MKKKKHSNMLNVEDDDIEPDEDEIVEIHPQQIDISAEGDTSEVELDASGNQICAPRNL